MAYLKCDGASVACRGGANGTTAPGIQSEITKIKMLQLDYFFCCKATNICCMDLIFWNLFFCQHYLSRVQMLIISHSSIPRTYTLGVRRTPNENDSDVTFFKSCDRGKIRKIIAKLIWTFSWFSESNFKTALFQLAWISYFWSITGFLYRFFLIWQTCVCANTAAHLCLQYMCRLIITVHTRPYLFCSPVVVHITAT